MVNRTGRRGWLAWGGAVGLGVLAAAAVCVSGMGGCAEERAEVPHAVAVANGIRPDPVTGAETAPVSRVPKMLEVYTQAVADGTKEQLDTAAAKADAKRLDAEQKAAAHAVRIDRNARTTAQKIRGLQDDLENDNAAEAALSAAEQRQFARDITDALAAGTTAAAAARAEGER
ncbi:MAG: hypothetical protein ACREJO_03580, partial [Phycisphaerales bacterium]